MVQEAISMALSSYITLYALLVTTIIFALVVLIYMVEDGVKTLDKIKGISDSKLATKGYDCTSIAGLIIFVTLITYYVSSMDFKSIESFYTVIGQTLLTSVLTYLIATSCNYHIDNFIGDTSTEDTAHGKTGGNT